jgi:endoglucanase
MKAGWNLGNTFDAAVGTSYECHWGAPVTTQKMIDEIKKKSFNLVRLPISYSRTVDPNGLAIPQSQLNRYKEVVDYCIKNNMYVIINSHHDNAPNDTCSNFYDMGTAYRTQTAIYLKAIWTQLANFFKDYDYHVIFESMNEPRAERGEKVGDDFSNPWWYKENNEADKKTIVNVNLANQIFVNAVRATGGNNAKRFLLVPSITANPKYACSSVFKLPDDSKCEFRNHILLSVHYYAPKNMSLQGSQSIFNPTSKEATDIAATMDELAARYTKRGVGVIIGEWGTSNLNNTEERVKQADFYVSQASRDGMVCVWWDNGRNKVGKDNFCIFNRRTLTWEFPSVADMIIKSANIVVM